LERSNPDAPAMPRSAAARRSPRMCPRIASPSGVAPAGGLSRALPSWSRASPDGDAILGHILGDRRAAAERGIAGASGLDISKVGPLLSMLAPLVMGALGRARSQGNLGPGQLSEVLAREGATLGGSSGIMGMVAGLLDRDHDGSVADDIGGMLGNLFRRS
jgi:hypothetical protein